MDLKKKIEEMSAEFAKMLKETLEKMQERINLAQWDNDNNPSMIKKMKEMKIQIPVTVKTTIPK